MQYQIFSLVLQKLSQTCTHLLEIARYDLLARCCSCFAQTFPSMDNVAENAFERKAKTIRYLKENLEKTNLKNKLIKAIRNKCFPPIIEIFLEAGSKPTQEAVEDARSCHYTPSIMRFLTEAVKKEEEAQSGPSVLQNPAVQLFFYQQFLLRIEFEKLLKELIFDSMQKEAPVCFISYAWGLNPQEEYWIDSPPALLRPVQEWISTHLLADLDTAGIKALFDKREVTSEVDPLDYRQNILSTPYVLLVCTAEMNKKIKKGKNAGDIHQELALICARYDEVPLRDKILPILYQGL